MDPVTKVLVLVDGGDDIGMKVARKRSRELNSFDSSGRNSAQQARERRHSVEPCQTRVRRWTIAINVLADQVNLTIAKTAEFTHLANNLSGGAALFPAARKRHDTVGTKLITALDDGNKRDIL